MIVDQSEIDALLAEADGLAGEAATTLAVEEAPPPPPPVAPPPPPGSDVARILKLRVPVIVRLARRQMTVATIRGLSEGAIIEFEKCVEDELDLMINNRVIGYGACVKVGEHFGLRILRIVDLKQRIKSLGGDA